MSGAEEVKGLEHPRDKRAKAGRSLSEQKSEKHGLEQSRDMNRGGTRRGRAGAVNGASTVRG